MSLEALIRAARLKMGPNRKARLANARKRSEEFNARCAEDFESMRMTPELLARRCTL